MSDWADPFTPPTARTEEDLFEQRRLDLVTDIIVARIRRQRRLARHDPKDAA